MLSNGLTEPGRECLLRVYAKLASPLSIMLLGYPVKNVLKTIWRYITATKQAVGNILFLAIILVLLIAVFSADKDISVSDPSVLLLQPDGVLVEKKRVVDPFEYLLNNGDNPYAEILLRDLIAAINFAQEDERITAIALDLSEFTGGSMSQLQEVAIALQSFKDTGKPVLAYAEQYNQKQYYLASFADEVYLDKTLRHFPGGVFLRGLGTYNLYLKSALEKIHAQPHVFQEGKYKSAVEIFTRDEMSDAAKEAANAWLNTLWDAYLASVREQRDISADDLANYINDYDTLVKAAEGDPGALAADYGLVDGHLSREEWQDKLDGLGTSRGSSEDSSETSETAEAVETARISMDTYLSIQRIAGPASSATEKIGIIIIDGVLVDGEDSMGNAGADSVLKNIQRAKDNDAIKALVVRINSPGGQVSASELIRSELVSVQDAGKPVVVSMAGVAASGGYWIASSADMIVASDTTITGSIGVFSLAMTFDQSLAQLGIHPDGVGTTAFSSSSLWFMPLNPAMKNMIRNSTNQTYTEFVNLVAKGRDISYAEAHAVAQGRVWAGATAFEHGLVDKLGTLEDALAAAAELAELDDYNTMYLEKSPKPSEIFIQEVLENLDASLGLNRLPQGLAEWFMLQQVLPQGMAPGTQGAGLSGLIKAPGIYVECLGCQINF